MAGHIDNLKRRLQPSAIEFRAGFGGIPLGYNCKVSLDTALRFVPGRTERLVRGSGDARLWPRAEIMVSSKPVRVVPDLAEVFTSARPPAGDVVLTSGMVGSRPASEMPTPPFIILDSTAYCPQPGRACRVPSGRLRPLEPRLPAPDNDPGRHIRSCVRLGRLVTLMGSSFRIGGYHGKYRYSKRWIFIFFARHFLRIFSRFWPYFTFPKSV